ncbi:LOW QUALITY PROTEIN: THAP domain-containing protein 8 [Sorex fumeus]|uniref:LOW QUALITY PROTEIN: THAP domain-containing protein 8 n=1 Tax=Sorex fumeus TaxID=62283 RepID=UPI0024ADFA8E|nr:LOW QUALITY PROTEIN: THAP domain-containing protein 8 [Sorex fumeus]
MPKYCRPPNCSNTAGRLGVDNRPVSFYQFPLKDGPRLQAWLRHMGRDYWVPSCHQHLCSEHFTPSCFQWCCGVRYLRPDAVPSIFSGAPPAQRLRNSGNPQKSKVLPPPPQEAPHPAGPAPEAAIHLVLLEPAPADPETPAGRAPLAPEGAVPTPFSRARLGAALGALRRRVRRLQRRRQARHREQLRTLEHLAQQLRGRACGPPAQELRALLRPEESQVFTIICGWFKIAVVLSQGPMTPTLDAKPELLDCETPGA